MVRSVYLLETVDRALRVLECFSPAEPELRLIDISTRLGMPKAQALRLASTLETRGYLVRDPQTKRYRLGVSLFHLGMIVQQGMDLLRIVHPVLDDVVARTQETARLVVPDGAGPVCVDVVDSPRGMRVFAQRGMRMPWNAGTSPKLILAYLPEDERERILSRGGFRRYTPRTITDPDTLRAEVLAIRAHGYYVGIRDLDEDAIGVSAPIFDYQRRVVGAINVSGPATRFTETAIARFVGVLVCAAVRISAQLGYQLDPSHWAAAGISITAEDENPDLRRG